MQNQVFYEIIRTKEKAFTDESDKKRFLDFVQQVKGETELKIFAFCITDEEGHFLFGGQSAKTIALMEAEIMKEFAAYYVKRYHKPCNALVRERKFRKFMTTEEILSSCLKLHCLPAERHLVRNPEDYWWCSYVDYRKNYRKGLVNTELVLEFLDADRKRAIRKFAALHNSSL